MSCATRRRNCDCGTCCDLHGHQSFCTSEEPGRREDEVDLAEEVALQDGYMRHPFTVITPSTAIRRPVIDGN
jgi:hypothetical protein